ncbi:hypothetical protein M3194_24850 [Paenibacillus glycanilyticus]|uniref:WapI family immunity protein n=1 Tax=Paenibacillus glycanilyticus TaxID=126569 RepID=UPI00204027E3|nr:hypothetical protein [Paenibacillus glycanilyticus]MCM3630566.1 hypothetical protein [Paenibacillus glycanilyticus]
MIILLDFIVRGKQGSFIRITLDEIFGFPTTTSHFGGYDVKGSTEIKSGSYYVNGEVWFSTGDTYEFYNQIVRCYTELDGTAIFCSTEENLKFEVKFYNRGQVVIEGCFQEFAHEDNELKFEFESNQSFFVETLDGLKKVVNQYGGLKGVRSD